MEAIDDLLEESWFFRNLLIITPQPANNSKGFMTRCFSDPCPCSSSATKMNNNIIVDISNKIIESEKKKQSDSPRRSSLVRAPSLPENLGILVEQAILEETEREGEDDLPGKETTSNKMLTRTQTLPSSMRDVDIAGLDNHDHHQLLPPRQIHKGDLRYRPPRNANSKGGIAIKTSTDGSKEMRRRYLNSKTLRKSASELEIEEVQGFKDLGFSFDKKHLLSPKVYNILPGLNQKKEDGDLDLGQNKMKRPYLSEAWTIQSCVSPAPNWALSRSSEDMKAQIKFWARSVATNVRMEC